MSSGDTVSPEKASVGGVPLSVGHTPTIGSGSGGGSGSEEGGKGGTGNVSTAAATAAPSSVSPSSSQFQRLKVEDALSYLDQVKLQFGSQPQVYNDFLDIMKEFKSQSIDTPGVISRVSNLFKGHSDLIVGFNTFLPPGFKIEVHGQNEINIHGPAQHSQTLQQIAMRHNSQAQAVANSNNSQNSSSRSSVSTGPKQSSQAASNSKPHSHQPVEFNHAINYVNKIKNRFQGQPDVYKAFLEILHTYQKEQRLIKDGNGPASQPIPLTETEVYGQVSKLFQNQEDLLSEFGQFLPDATASHQLASLMGSATSHSKKQTFGKSKSHSRKTSQSSSSNNGPPSKKMKSGSSKDILAEAGKHGGYSEMALFDKIRKCLNPEVYDNFLRCLVLFNEEIVSRHDLIQLVTSFLGKYPDLFSQFKTLLGFKEPSAVDLSPENTPPPPQFPNKDRTNDFAAEIDFNSLKRHGASYRALPKTYIQPKCSGRTQLCQEVLNDTWVSFPMWSEDSTFHGTRKTQYEEYIFRCEDERFELDIVLETNLSTIKVLEAVQKKIERMSPEEISGFMLTDTLGGFSETIHRKSIYRIYGEKATDIIEGMKRNPAISVPPVLKRLKAKQDEWYEAQKQFNKIWREQLEKYYLKSLDHQGINFKATDTRNMRSKSLIGEVEALYDERQEQMIDGKTGAPGPHLIFNLPACSTVHTDAVSLVVYYMKRASSLSKEDGTKIKTFLTCTLSDFCYYDRVTLTSDDDLSLDSDSDNMEVDQEVKPGAQAARQETDKSLHPDTPPHYLSTDKHSMYTNNTIYTFFRLFQFLWERLNKVYQQSLLAIENGLIDGGNSLQESVAVRLGLKKLPEIQVEEYYPTFLNMAKNYMEGNIDGATYEDTCREMFGVQAYLAFTLDRLVQNIVRQLHTLVADESCLKLMEYYTRHVEGLADVTSTASMLTTETQYQKKVEAFLNDENCYKVVVTSDKSLSIELLESEESSDDNGTETKKWSAYIEQYCKDEPSNDQNVKQMVQNGRIFLKRNHRKPMLLTSTMSSPSSDDATNSAVDKVDKNVDDLLMQFDTHGELEFKMDERTYRMIPLANSGDYLYKKRSLSRAEQLNSAVFGRKKERYYRWYDHWCSSHPSSDTSSQCSEWFHHTTTAPAGNDGDGNTGSTTTSRQQEEFNGQTRYRYTQQQPPSTLDPPANVPPITTTD